MNHWILCGRDVMWVILMFLPLFLSSYFGYEVSKKEEVLSFNVMAFAIGMQVTMVVLLYTGAIR